MEPANFHEHRQEADNQLVMDSSCYGLSWNHNHMLNDTSFTAQELVELQQLSRIKNEISVTGSCFELPDIISSEDFMSKNNNSDQFVRYNNVNNQDMLLKTFSNGCQIKNDHLMNPIPSFDLTNSCYRGTFSQIFPTLKFSNLNQPLSSFDMNLPALDSFGYPIFNGSFNYQPSFNAHNLGDLLKDNCLSYGVDQMHSKIAPTFIVETTEAKRPASNGMDAKAAPKTNPSKKSKLDMRPSCTQLKVRKEKLGDRILALQQMVAPFGKTDTASVLMEAIGYIKFLQSQVETLSMPYMNSTSQASRMSTRGDLTNDGNEETKKDLRSRGLCLVPVSCLTYVTYGGGSVWPTL
ncbi:putative transcription factor bHLH family [Helianthus debilis subsp. tardiflorus]